MKKSRKKKSNISPWNGWSSYFGSEEGVANICEVVNALSAKAAERGTRWVGGVPKHVQYAPITSTSAATLMAELMLISPRLAAVIPQEVMREHKDSGIIELSQISKTPSDIDCYNEDRVNFIMGALAMMSYGVTCSGNLYTGGSDECDLQNTTMSILPTDFNPSCEDDFYSSESEIDGDKVEELCAKVGISSDFFFGFSSDSGAGDGTGTWTNNFIVRLMPTFGFGLEEGEFTEYECDLCDNPQSACTCVWDENGDLITKEEAERREAAAETPARKRKGKKA
jgi:hypothetical protein